MQKPVTNNLMKWKSSVPPAPFVAFPPCTAKVPKTLSSTGCPQQLPERETSQGDPAPLQTSQIQSCSPSEIFSTMQGLCSIPPWGRMCYAADNSNDSPSNALQGVSNARCHVLACSSMQGVAVLLFREGNRRILQAKLSRQPCSNGNTLIW